jgi:GT2 family glycosyltransferase
MKLTFIAACFNRRELTVRAAHQVLASADLAGVSSTLIVYDDGSSDGTSESLLLLDPRVEVLAGDGAAFWAKSMAAAENHALGQEVPPDYIVWINDDVDFDDDFLQRILTTAQLHPDAVVVGATREPGTQNISYSGMVRGGVHPLNFTRVEPAVDDVLPVETFNGNLVVVPVDVARRLGGLDGQFSHGLADIDYGLRCGRAGVSVLLAPGTYGECARNAIPELTTVSNDWKRFTSAKGGGNFGSLRHILRKSNPVIWPAVISATYAKWIVKRLAQQPAVSRQS